MRIYSGSGGPTITFGSGKPQPSPRERGRRWLDAGGYDKIAALYSHMPWDAAAEATQRLALAVLEGRVGIRGIKRAAIRYEKEAIRDPQAYYLGHGDQRLTLYSMDAMSRDGRGTTLAERVASGELIA